MPTTSAQWQAAAIARAARKTEEARAQLAAEDLHATLAAHISAASILRGVIAERDQAQDRLARAA